jgi:hypothetical protein
MYYAENGKISTEVLPNGIQITEEQYQEALEGMMQGKEVRIDNGFEVVYLNSSAPVGEQTQYKTQFTSLEYLDRFTDEEEDSIILAAESNIQIRKYYNRLLAATYIDINDSRTEQGLDALIMLELLAPERKEQLLAPEIIED